MSSPRTAEATRDIETTSSLGELTSLSKAAAICTQLPVDFGGSSIPAALSSPPGILQEAWKEVDVPQCGYCQAGQIMTAAAFLEENDTPTREEIRAAMHGNICRCAAYNRIEEAVALAAKNV